MVFDMFLGGIELKRTVFKMLFAPSTEEEVHKVAQDALRPFFVIGPLRFWLW